MVADVRLGQIILRAHFEADDPVGLITHRGHHDHRDNSQRMRY